MRILIFVIRFVSILLLTACSNSTRDNLERIDSLSESNPESAIAALDSISPSELAERDRVYYHLLTIKTADKAYVTHTTDTLINKVIEFYKTQDKREKYAEALYYGGRVKSDLGDYPAALGFFRQGLEVIHKHNLSSINIHANLLSQSARLYNKLRLFSEADSCVDEVIRIEVEQDDYLNLMYDHELSGNINTYHKKYDKANSSYKAALKIANSKYPWYTPHIKMYLAGLKRVEGKPDSALMLIRGVLDSIGGIDRNIALSYTAGIYFDAGIPDTAAMYAHELTKYENDANLKQAYYILSNPKLRGVVPEDSVQSYIDKYQEATEQYMRTNGDKAALIQNSMFNYQSHEHEKAKALQDKANILIIAGYIGLLLAIMIILFLLLKIKHKRQYILMRDALEKARNLKICLKSSEDDIDILKKDLETAKRLNESRNDFFNIRRKPDYQDIRENIRNEYKEIAGGDSTSVPVDQKILMSEVYGKFVEILELGKSIPRDSKLWLCLEDIVLEASPEFKNRLEVLANETIDDETMHTALLIKCGFKPSQMKILLALSPTGISSRRCRLCELLFSDKMGNIMFDNIMRKL